MDLAQLEVFLAVAREGRFSRAAEKLHRTQSAVSQSIHKLEEEMGEPLFDRSSRDGRLTDAGRVLQEYAERLLNLRDDAAEALAELRQLHRGKLSIAANEFTALYLLPVLAEFRRLHPMIRIAVQRSLGSHIPGDVLRHNSELGVLTYDPQEPQLHSIVAYLDELIFVVPPTHPLAGEAQVSIRQLGAESFVAHIVSSPYREKVIQAFKRHKTPLHMDIELPTLQAIKRFVAMGNGVALLPAISVENELARGELVRIPGAGVAPAPQTAAGLSRSRQPVPRGPRVSEGSGGVRAGTPRPLPFSARTLRTDVGASVPLVQRCRDFSARARTLAPTHTPRSLTSHLTANENFCLQTHNYRLHSPVAAHRGAGSNPYSRKCLLRIFLRQRRLFLQRPHQPERMERVPRRQSPSLGRIRG